MSALLWWLLEHRRLVENGSWAVPAVSVVMVVVGVCGIASWRVRQAVHVADDLLAESPDDLAEVVSLSDSDADRLKVARALAVVRVRR